MSKAVLISIRPKWCELIASLDKTIEVRKTAPKIETPFKCYIYCTKPSKAYQTICGCMVLNSDELYRHPRHGIRHGDSIELMVEDDYTADNFLNGKVIGEFTCDRIFPITAEENGPFSEERGGGYSEDYSAKGFHDCLTDEEFDAYLSGKPGYGWHISDLVIYDKPKKLTDFIRPSGGCCNEGKCTGCKYLDKGNGYNVEDDCFADFDTDSYSIVTRPPQSWGYVEELP